MSRSHSRRTVLFLIGLLATALIVPPAFADVGYPNPYPNPSLVSRDGPEAPAVIMVGDVEYGGWGSRPISFDEPDATNGTTFELYMRIVPPEPYEPPPFDLIATFIKNSGHPGPFTLIPGETIGPDGFPCDLLQKLNVYEWYVLSDYSGESAHWFFETPMEQPADGSQRVGTMVRFVWDANGPYEVPHVTEKMLLLRRGDPDVEDGWFVGDPLAFNESAVVKTQDYRNSDRTALREFWWPDSGYARLLPNRNYRWRVVYCDKDGKPLTVDWDGDDAADSLAWADGGGDFDPGWNFTTVNEASYQSSSRLTSVIVYWESMYGTKTRDPEEGDVTFKDIADNSDWYFDPGSPLGFKQIHELVHHPSVESVAISTEELTASYGGLNNDHSQQASCTPQQALVPDITQWPGWFTIPRDSKDDDPYYFALSEQDKYEAWVSLNLRTWLQDAANKNAWGNNDKAWVENLQHVLLVGDADRVAPSFYYYYRFGISNSSDSEGGIPMWVPTDFFYSTQDSAGEVKTTPRYQIGRIPVRAKSYPTIDENYELYDPPIPALKKFTDYSWVMSDDGEGRTEAYNNWFGRAVVVAGATEYGKWHQFFPAVAQYLLGQRVQTGGSSYRDTFAGLDVRKYDPFGAYGSDEALTASNVLRHLADPASEDIVPGFIYLLGRSVSFDPTDYQVWRNSGNYFFLWSSNSTDYFSSSVFGSAYEDAASGHRPLLVSPTSSLGRYDHTILPGSYGSHSIGESGTLAAGGPIGVVAFSSGGYDNSRSYPRTFDERDFTMTWSGAVDEMEGYTNTSLSHGVLNIDEDGNPNLGIEGKIEVTRDFANEYAETNMPTLGGLFNNALATYLGRHSEELLANDELVASTVFGATLLGDSSILLPPRVRPNQDNSRPVVADMNPRVPTLTDATLPSYNTQDIPVHIVPHTEPYDPDTGVTVSLRIQTNATHVRVRVMTPFRQNLVSMPGYWNDLSLTNWDYDFEAEDVELRTTVDGVATYFFTPKAPSIYLVVVQAQNPKWLEGQDEAWRWLQERWIYVQTVNDFQRSSDATTNILVVDGDQYDRYHLNGYYWNDVEEWYIHPTMDDAGYLEGDDPADYRRRPALPVLNNEIGPWYKYQYWNTNTYYSVDPDLLWALGLWGDDLDEAERNAARYETMRETQRFMGDITQGGLDSFLASKGTVVLFTGDYSHMAPRGYHFIRQLLEARDAEFLTDYVNEGGRLLLSNQNMVNEGDWVPFLADLQHNILGAVSQTHDTDYTNMDGLKDGTMSALITDLNIVNAWGDPDNDAGPTGVFNEFYETGAINTGEVDPNGTEAKTLFTWSDAYGPGTTTGSTSSGISNRILAGGGRTIYFTWPFESIYTLGTVDPGSTGRANVMRQAIDWLRSVPKAAGPSPEDLADNVPLDQILSWGIVPEAAGYRLYLGTDQATLTTDPDNLHDNISRDNPRFDPADELAVNTRYFWRVDTKNVDDYTIGDVWSFTTLDNAPVAINPMPLNGATNVPLDQVLSWYQDPLVDTYDITLEDGVGPPVTAEGLMTAQFVPPGGLQPNTIYTWRVDTVNGAGLTTGMDWTFTTIMPPPPPVNPPNPVDGAAGVATNQKLSWTAVPGADSYDVFIWIDGDDPPAAPPAGNPFSTVTPNVGTFSIWSGSTDTNSFVPGELPADETTMYWQVRPVNVAGRQNGLDIDENETEPPLLTWSFTTEAEPADPVAPARPIYPTLNAYGVETSPTLSWERGQGASSYDVYFGADDAALELIAEGVAIPEAPVPATLVVGQRYLWRVVAINSLGHTATGSIWGFTVGHASKVTGMVPADEATGVGVDVTLNWDDARGAASYDVYLIEKPAVPPKGGTDPDMGQAVGNPAVSQFTPNPALQPLTTYLWRVDSVSADRVDITTGDVYEFTTGISGGMADVVTNMFPANQATAVAVDVTLNWDDARGAVEYKLYMAEGATGTLPTTPTATITESRYAPRPLLKPLTIYRWRVDSVPDDPDVIDSTGPLYTFTTTTADGMPGAVTRMVPANNAANVRTDVALTWVVGPGALTYDLFFGAGALPGTPTVTGLPGATTRYEPAADLAQNTTYYWMVRSINTLGHTDSAVFSFTTTDGTAPPPDAGGGGGGGGGCFIATSAFESVAPASGDATETNFTGLFSIAPERLDKLNDIRGLRDDVLLPLSAGRSFSAWYYAVGPHAADAIRHNEPAKAAVRKVLLDPLSRLSKEIGE